MNDRFHIGERVILKLDIYYQELNKGDIGIVIDYEDKTFCELTNNKILNRIECMVEFIKVDKKGKKKIHEPFTLHEAELYLDFFNEETDDEIFFK